MRAGPEPNQTENEDTGRTGLNATRLPLKGPDHKRLGLNSIQNTLYCPIVRISRDTRSHSPRMTEPEHSRAGADSKGRHRRLPATQGAGSIAVTNTT